MTPQAHQNPAGFSPQRAASSSTHCRVRLGAGLGRDWKVDEEGTVEASGEVELEVQLEVVSTITTNFRTLSSDPPPTPLTLTQIPDSRLEIFTIQ